MKKDIPKILDQELIDKYLAALTRPINLELLNEMTSGKYSHSSLLAIRKDWQLFHEFCVEMHVNSLPASVTAVRRFIDKQSKSRKYSSIRRYVITIGMFHYLLGFKDPTSHRQVGFSLSELRTSEKHQSVETNPFTDKHLNELNKRLFTSNEALDIRDLAIYFCMYECALKRHELRELTHSSLRIEPNLVAIEISDQLYILSEQGSIAMIKWLEVSSAQGDIVFCSIDRHGNLSGRQLNDSSIYRILRRASALLSLPEHLKFSSQSGRVGQVKKRAKSGQNIIEIQDFGRWSSPAMPLQYAGKLDSSDKQKQKFRHKKEWD
ncbi:tyrosine-type recombinase/integrase [Vibrio sp. ZSDZ34]|jgi:site-specific recombinase XerD|uniref:Tyrosine-type recombinase/integrase n=1 Tax=Vibrio gelatinilyticus TaxID=2893468 RepID=A0A9X1WA63_9VIBR|nr:tyrosine-type recombinase/integrase [Vibrio gelatinilyticus]MCJ2377152.1 tyrosine-type recombinase/integrase [Vibrio gelatinilyticus]